MSYMKYPRKPPTPLQMDKSFTLKKFNQYLVISESGLKAKLEQKNGRNVWWTTDLHTEIPMKIRRGEGPAAVEPITIPELFLKNVREAPSKIAMEVERQNKWVKWTWTRFYNEAANFGKALMALRVEERRCVNIIGFNSPEWIIAFIGSILANDVPSGVYPTNKPEACLDIVKLANPAVIVMENKAQLEKYEQIMSNLDGVLAFVLYNDKLPDHRKKDPRFYEWEQFLLKGATFNFEGTSQRLEERMYKQFPGMCCELIFTSGTTGKPKGVMISHDALLWKSQSANGHLNPTMDLDNLVMISYLPISHVAAQEVELAALLSHRARVVFARPDALQGTLFRTLRYAKPTNFFAVPRVWEKIETELRNRESRQSLIRQKIWEWAKKIGFKAVLNRMAGKPPPLFYPLANFLVFKPLRKSLGLQRCQACYFGAAPINRSTLQYFASFGIPLINCYGMSQLSGLHTSCYNLPFWFKFGPTGPPIRDSSIKIISDNRSSREGEICMRGRNQFQGYLHNEEQTLKTIDGQGFVHSGDIGHIDDQGFVYVTGRIKEIIITSGGQNVAPVPIEHKLKELCPIISNVMLVGDNRKFISALLTLKCKIDLMSGRAQDQLQPEALSVLYQEKLIDRKESEPKVSEVMVNPQVQDYIDQKIKKLNELYVVSRAAQIRKWRLLPGDFSVGGGHLTPSMKLRRKVVTQIYQKQIQELYLSPKL